MSAQPVLDMELRKREELATTPTLTIDLAALAANPDVSVDKLERLMLMQERMLANQAKAAFDDAFAAMQAELPVIGEKGKTDKGTYAPLEDIVEAVRPILARHGFSLCHETTWPGGGIVKIVGVLSHRQGHERRSEFQSIADSSGSKNAIQGLGSAMSYGRRYTTNDLLNIVTRKQDDDGKKAGPTAPDDYDEWITDLTAVADNGLPELQKLWARSAKDLKEYMAKHDAALWTKLKAKAAKVQA